ncbi:MAG: response regulator [Candidatus Binatia bacterium]
MSERVRVLAVDDSITIRKALELILVPAGYAVEFAASGAEALDAVRRQAPALVLLDFILPDLRGTDVCRALLADPSTADLPVVLISARGAEIRQAYQDAPNVVRYLTKPFTPEDVLGVVAEVAAMVVDGTLRLPKVVAPLVDDLAPAAAAPSPGSLPSAAALDASPAASAGLDESGWPPSTDDEEEAAPAIAPPVADRVAAFAAPDPVGYPVSRHTSAVADPTVDARSAPVLRSSPVGEPAPPPRRESLEWVFETLRAGLEGVSVEEMDTPTGAAADQAQSYAQLASRLGVQLAEALRQAESGARYALCSDGSVRSLGDTLLDSYRRVCRLLFRAAAAGAVDPGASDERPRVLVVCHRDSAVREPLERASREAVDWHVLRVAADFRQLPMTARLYGPTHAIVDAGHGGALWDQIQVIRALPEGRRLQIIGVVPDGAAPPNRERAEALGLSHVVEAGADLLAELRTCVQPGWAAAA